MSCLLRFPVQSPTDAPMTAEPSLVFASALDPEAPALLIESDDGRELLRIDGPPDFAWTVSSEDAPEAAAIFAEHLAFRLASFWPASSPQGL